MCCRLTYDIKHVCPTVFTSSSSSSLRLYSLLHPSLFLVCHSSCRFIAPLVLPFSSSASFCFSSPSVPFSFACECGFSFVSFFRVSSLCVHVFQLLTGSCRQVFILYNHPYSSSNCTVPTVPFLACLYFFIYSQPKTCQGCLIFQYSSNVLVCVCYYSLIVLSGNLLCLWSLCYAFLRRLVCIISNIYPACSSVLFWCCRAWNVLRYMYVLVSVMYRYCFHSAGNASYPPLVSSLDCAYCDSISCLLASSFVSSTVVWLLVLSALSISFFLFFLFCFCFALVSPSHSSSFCLFSSRCSLPIKQTTNQPSIKPKDPVT